MDYDEISSTSQSFLRRCLGQLRLRSAARGDGDGRHRPVHRQLRAGGGARGAQVDHAGDNIIHCVIILI